MSQNAAPSEVSSEAAPEVPSISKELTVCLACPCGAREEIRDSAPDVLDCWSCRTKGGMTPYVPRFPPPHGAGRALTETEMRNGRG